MSSPQQQNNDDDSTDEDNEFEPECLIDPQNDRREPAFKTEDAGISIIDCIGKLKIRYQYKQEPLTTYGTGTVINVKNGQCHVLTCAHNVRRVLRHCKVCGLDTLFNKCQCGKTTTKSNPVQLLQPERVTFQRTKDSKFYSVRDIKVPPKYKQFPNPSHGYDIAVLLIEPNKNEEDVKLWTEKCANIELVSDSTLGRQRKDIIRMYGFPGKVKEQTNEILCGMATSRLKGKVHTMSVNVPKGSKSKKPVIDNPELDASVGQSGSAIWGYHKYSGVIIIYGVHCGGSKSKKEEVGRNVATFLDAENMKFVRCSMMKKSIFYGNDDPDETPMFYGNDDPDETVDEKDDEKQMYNDNVHPYRKKTQKEEFLHLVMDILCPLFRYKVFIVFLGRVINEYKGEDFYLYFIDIDNFKKVNKMLSHQKADEYLSKFGRILKEFGRKSSKDWKKLGIQMEKMWAFRTGGDRFSIVVKGKQSIETQTKFYELLKSKTNSEMQLTFSAGVLIYGGTKTPEQWTKLAEVALKKAKSDGKNTYRVYNGDSSEIVNSFRHIKQSSTKKDYRISEEFMNINFGTEKTYTSQELEFLKPILPRSWGELGMDIYLKEVYDQKRKDWLLYMLEVDNGKSLKTELGEIGCDIKMEDVATMLKDVSNKSLEYWKWKRMQMQSIRAFHLGGGEFSIIVTGIGNIKQQENFYQLLKNRAAEFELTFSVGVLINGSELDKFDRCLREVEMAMDCAIQKGGDTYQIFDAKKSKMVNSFDNL